MSFGLIRRIGKNISRTYIPHGTRNRSVFMPHHLREENEKEQVFTFQRGLKANFKANPEKL